MNWLDKFPFLIAVILVLSLGLAPFTPEPHVWEKLKLLMAGNLVRPVDMFDFALHGTPWLLLIAKLVRMVRGRS